MRSWGSRRWGVAAAVAVVTALFIGLSTVLIPNPVFSREIPPVWWNYPTWVVTSALSGLLVATYVRDTGEQDGELDRDSRRGGIGGLLGYFAVGCPVCNKLVLIALGSTGAVTYYAPIQPLLAVAGIVLMAVALRGRLRGARACPTTVAPPSGSGRWPAGVE